MDSEDTFCMIKPGVCERALMGQVISRIEQSGLRIRALHMIKIPRTQCETHYREHIDKPFFNDLVTYMSSAPVVIMVVSGPSAIAHMRRLTGATNPAEAAPGTIRGDFALETQNNIIHASDSPAAAAREINLFFEVADLQP